MSGFVAVGSVILGFALGGLLLTGVIIFLVVTIARRPPGERWTTPFDIGENLTTPGNADGGWGSWGGGLHGGGSDGGGGDGGGGGD